METTHFKKELPYGDCDYITFYLTGKSVTSKELQDLSDYVIPNGGQYRWLLNFMVKVTLAAWSDRLLCAVHLLFRRSPLYELKEKGPRIKKKQKTEKNISQNASHRHYRLLHLSHCGQPPSQNSKVDFHFCRRFCFSIGPESNHFVLLCAHKRHSSC